MPKESDKYFGKFRGTVLNNQDPLRIGRLQVQITDVTLPASWAMPCVPLAGAQSGVFVVPAVGSNLWVEFERGDPEYPVWVGGYWADAAQVPQGGQAPGPAGSRIVIESPLHHCITVSDFDDGTGGIVLQSPDGASLRISRAGVILTNGKGASIQLVGPTVDINNGALAVT